MMSATPSLKDYQDWLEIQKRLGAGAPGGSPVMTPIQVPAAAPAPPAPPQGMAFGGQPAAPQPALAASQQAPLMPSPSPIGMDVPQVQKPTGMFGHGGTGWKILGSLSDGLIGATGGTPRYGPMLADMRKEDRQTQLQGDILSRQTALQQYKVDHPVDPTILRTADALFKRGTPQWTEFVRAVSLKPTFVAAPNESGGTDYIDPTGLSAPPVPSGPSPDAEAYLKANPGLAAQFDEKYGAGASRSVLGQ